MKVENQTMRSIWVDPENPLVVKVIDQRALPHQLVIEELATVEQAARAIRDMHIRGAPLIGVTAAYGLYLAALAAVYKKNFDACVMVSASLLRTTRPTAINLNWALERSLEFGLGPGGSNEEKVARFLENAGIMAEEDVETCRLIGAHGLELIQTAAEKKPGKPVNILTHCNAGWLATVDYGTATSPIYQAHDAGIPVHVWVDETRPRNQGARITAWELGQHGVPHTVIPDNTGGHLMQHGMVDLVIVGSDRTTYTGDVANKIGTYLKALAAQDNDVPFYVALPGSTFDWNLSDGIQQIPIEERGSGEVKFIQGLHEGEIKQVLLTPENSPAANYAFDVTPARLVTGLITERGICKAEERDIFRLFPEFAPMA